MRIGMGVGGGGGPEGPVGEIIQQIQQAEAAGFDLVWMPNIFGLDAITVLALAGRETSRIELATGVVPTYPRHPVAIAQQALTAAAASGNRFTLGIGLSHRVIIENMLGLDYSKPLRHMREYLSVLLPLLDGRPARFRGEEYRVAAELTVPGVTRVPVLLAALGPQMLKLAGEKVDGTVTWMGGPKYLAETAIPLISQAASAVGKPAPRIAAGFPLAVTSNKDATRASAAQVFAVYGQLPSYRAALDIEGAADASSVAIVGSEGEVEAQIRALAASGVTDFNAMLYPVEGDPAVAGRSMEFLAGLAKRGI